MVGQWGLIPWFAKSAKLTYSTNNARFEEIAGKASYKQWWLRDVDAWLRGSIDAAAGLMRAPPVELIEAGPQERA